MSDTIFALSSAPGKAGVAVVRISGAQALDAWFALTEGPRAPGVRIATVAVLKDKADGTLIDEALVLWFPGTASFTGEPVLELHLHGGAAILKAVFAILGSLDGFRFATAGEFTRRAFENGKLDLAQAEAIALVIEAETEQQRRQALRGLSGDLGRMVAGWRSQILALRGLMAAQIDFSDEGDVSDEPTHEIDSLLQQLAGQIEMALETGRKGLIVSEGFNAAIVGPPNSGKSSLLNALAGYDAAIVTEFAGTTRDLISVKLNIGGFPVIVTDTAGLRETSDPVERIGISRARAFAEQADLVLHLDPDGAWSDILPSVEPSRLIRIRSKVDLAGSDGDCPGALRLSVRSKNGLEELMKRFMSEMNRFEALPALVATERQKVALSDAHSAIARCLGLPWGAIELRDHEVRAAEAALDVLVGRLGVEDVLGAVFSRFCIGK